MKKKWFSILVGSNLTCSSSSVCDALIDAQSKMSKRILKTSGCVQANYPHLFYLISLKNNTSRLLLSIIQRQRVLMSGKQSTIKSNRHTDIHLTHINKRRNKVSMTRYLHEEYKTREEYKTNGTKREALACASKKVAILGTETMFTIVRFKWLESTRNASSRFPLYRSRRASKPRWK